MRNNRFRKYSTHKASRSQRRRRAERARRHGPFQLYKIPEDGQVMGVCAGLADYFDTNVTMVRVMVFFAIIFTGIFPSLLVYFLIGLFLPAKPVDLYEEEEEERFWTETRTAPARSASDLTQRFRELDRRTAELEAMVTSKRFKLERELRDLED